MATARSASAILGMALLISMGGGFSSARAADLRLDFPEPQIDSLSFTLQDKRPAKQLKTGPEAFSAGNCAYSSLRVGDNLFEPSRIDLVADRLQRDFGPKLTGKLVVVENFVIHRNFGKQARDVLRKTGPDLVSLAVGKVMAGAAPMSCAPDDLRGGYSPEETPHDIAPIVIVLDIAIDGVRYHVRTVYEPVVRVDKEKPAAFVERSLSAALQQNMDELARQVAASNLTGAPVSK